MVGLLPYIQVRKGLTVSLVLYDTKARAKREFVPIDPERVGMYVCGPTVYDRAHIGNARPVIVFDVLYRLLRRIYGDGNVTYVRNITDVDDKIIAAAQNSGRSISDITASTTQVFQDDMVALGALPPDHEPRATDHIEGMVAMAETLIARGHAYEAEGHVLFHVPSMKDYGALSRRSLKDMIAGARVEVAPYKKSPADFVLWKPSTDDQPGWDSPWGRGRPGWHLECSVMSEKYLGVPVDIHGGGQDLIFPHHENERAQSLCAHDGLETFANYWMHNGFVVVEGREDVQVPGQLPQRRRGAGRHRPRPGRGGAPAHARHSLPQAARLDGGRGARGKRETGLLVQGIAFGQGSESGAFAGKPSAYSGPRCA